MKRMRGKINWERWTEKGKRKRQLCRGMESVRKRKERLRDNNTLREKEREEKTL